METENQEEVRRQEYVSRINRVLDYIDLHLNATLSLSLLADVACFSPFHFHRIFQAFLGETLNQYIQRVRLEKAASQLLHSPAKTITDITFDCGFSSSTSFARAFGKHFGMSATQWRQTHNKAPKKRKIGNTESKIGKADSSARYYFNHNLRPRSQPMKNQYLTHINIEERSPFAVAYIRNIGPYKGDGELFASLFSKLMAWAGPRNLLQFPRTQILSVYHDDPAITDETKLRMSVCISIPETVEVDGEIGKMTVPGGKYAVARFELPNAAAYEVAWNYIFGEWFPKSGFQPDDRPSFEIYQNNPEEDPDGKHLVDICVPVKPL